MYNYIKDFIFLLLNFITDVILNLNLVTLKFIAVQDWIRARLHGESWTEIFVSFVKCWIKQRC